MTRPSPEVPEFVSLGAKAVVDNAKRLGLTWTMRPATVSAVDSPVEGIPEILYDGDTVGVAAVSLVGAVNVGERVMGLILPPAGNFIIGLSTSQSDPFAPEHGILGSHIETVNSGAIAGLTTVMTTDQMIKFRNGRAYEFCFAHNHFSSGVGVLAQYSVDLTTGGLPPLHMGNYRTEGASSTGVYHSKIAVCSSDVTDTAILSALAVTGTVTMLGSASAPRQFWVRDAGPGELYQGFTSF